MIYYNYILYHITVVRLLWE